MSTETLERSVLEGKDREQLLAIASALGVKGLSRAKKGDIIDRILQQTGVTTAPASPASSPTPTPAPSPTPVTGNGNGRTGAPVAALDDAAPAPAVERPAATAPAGADEPLPEWEIELREQGVDTTITSVAPSRVPSPAPSREDADEDTDGDGGEGGDGEGGSRKRRRRRRRRGAGDDGQDRPQDRLPDRMQDRPDRPQERADRDTDFGASDVIEVSGYLDLRDEGYGFLRVHDHRASRDDVYVSVKQTRQFGLRKGDHIVGMSRTASRNEKNPALLEVNQVNGDDPEKARNRPQFEDLTPLFPDEKLRLENPLDPSNMTARIVDLVCPIGKGQRGLIVSPPKAGKTTVMKTIATSIERNNPEVKLIVLLIDERPEEVTDFRRTIKGEVVASTFDRPSDEHTHVAELVIERAKRLVEGGADVVIILDGITRLARAYNLAAPATGRIMSGGIDAGALYPPKKFFGAARNIEEGGSLTILATALVETNSRMDEAIFEEFKGTGNMELRLDRRLAERRVFPSIDVDASSTRHEELLFDRRQLQMVWKLRRVLSGLAAEGNAAPGLELLIDRLKTFRNNDEFLAEIAKQPMM
jgi:transcription termination factor Rho